MANIYLWNQGGVAPSGPLCDGIPPVQDPRSQRIAAEFFRGWYTLTEVIHPLPNSYDYNNTGYKQRVYDDVEVGDVIYLLMTPPQASVVSISAIAGEGLGRGANFKSMLGLGFTVVMDEFRSEGLIEDPNDPGQTIYSTDIDSTQPFENLYESDPINITSDVISRRNKGTNSSIVLNAAADVQAEDNRWIGVGVKITSLPDSGTLGDVSAYLALIAQGFDMQHQLGS